MSECRESIVIRKIVPIVPHDNNACASLSREKSIYPRNSLFHGKPNALCTGLSDALGTFPASRVCRENEHPRKKAGALLLQRRPLRVHSSTIRMLQICHHDQGRRAIHANMYDFHREEEPEMAHMPRRTSSACTSMHFARAQAILLLRAATRIYGCLQC